MLLNKLFYIIILLSAVISFSCGEKEPSPDLVSRYNNPSFVLQESKKLLGANVKFAYKGTYDQDSVVQIAAGTELTDQEDWGIKFYQLKLKGEELNIVYETELLKGSFNDCLVKTIKFPGFNYELIYYNSQAYFLGSSGGEVFSYILDFNENKTYYAHLVNDARLGTNLYLSDNIESVTLKNFFNSVFRKDYPELKMVSEDIELSF